MILRYLHGTSYRRIPESRAEKKLLLKLQEAEEAVKDGEGWLDLDELKALVGE